MRVDHRSKVRQVVYVVRVYVREAVKNSVMKSPADIYFFTFHIALESS
jgi:hypothetical protein